MSLITNPQPADLICASEIAEYLGVLPSAISNWRKRESVNFPEPWGVWRNGALWLKDDIEAWWIDRQHESDETRQRTIAYHEAQLARLKAKG